LTLSDAQNAFKARQVAGQDAATAAVSTLEELKRPETAFGFIPVGGSVSAADQAKLDAQIEIIKGLQKAIADLNGMQELVQLQRENNELMKQQVKQPQRPPQPAVRPKEAPLPAATAP
jgi:hypothetical protein